MNLQILAPQLQTFEVRRARVYLMTFDIVWLRDLCTPKLVLLFPCPLAPTTWGVEPRNYHAQKQSTDS